ncbi:MAG: hypothetical protein HC852_20540 [Acaryochloridaceae cyanobacterium RU_4_10]|nr:hypothetical protein [Acaryochloridaceae cyanobacterium RU_4_10]
MNKSELIAHLKQGTDIIDKILDAAQLPADLQEFMPEQIVVLEAIAQLVETKQAKTYKLAGEIYRKPLRENQLEEIAFRHAIAHDRMAEILTAMKLKPETLTDEQLTLFDTVCQQLHAGMDFDMAVQSVAPPKQTKGKKASAQALPEFAPQSESGSAIALTNNGSMPGLLAQITPVVNQEQRANIDQVVDVLAPHATPNIVEIAAQEAARQCEGIEAYTRHSLANKIVSSPKMNVDPNEAVVRFHEIIAENEAKRRRPQQKRL